MVSSIESQLQSRIVELEKAIAVLKAENDLLRKKLGASVWRIDGAKAEALIHKLVGGIRTHGSAGHDLKTGNGHTIEIKFSNLNQPNKSAMRRWVWAHVLGRDNAKRFDRLILVAPQDPQFRKDARDPESPVVLFDIPYNDVSSLAERDGMIWIGTSPVKFKRETHRRLMLEFQITQKDLVSRYGCSGPPS